MCFTYRGCMIYILRYFYCIIFTVMTECWLGLSNVQFARFIRKYAHNPHVYIIRNICYFINHFYNWRNVSNRNFFYGCIKNVSFRHNYCIVSSWTYLKYLPPDILQPLIKQTSMHISQLWINLSKNKDGNMCLYTCTDSL